MRYIQWFVLAVIALFIAAVFHYTLPQKDIVRITDTENRRIDFGENSPFWAAPDAGNQASETRDVFFIQTVQRNGDPMVYRNEDTGWGWPPYFKFDTANLQTEAADNKSTSDNPKWVLVTHYGWRVVYFSIYPNAISVTPMEDPEAGKPIPWLNIIVIGLFLFITISIWVRWRRWRMANIDPTLEEWQDNIEDFGDAVQDRRGRVRKWLDTWKSK